MNRDILKILAVLALLIGLISAKYIFFPAATDTDLPPIEVATPETPQSQAPATLEPDGKPIDLRPSAPDDGLSSAQDSLKHELDRELQSNALFKIIKNNFPEDYQTALISITKVADQDDGREQASQIGFELTTRLRKENADTLLMAPRANLKKTIQAYLAIYEYLLASDGVMSCSRYVVHGPDTLSPMSDTLTELTISVATTTFQAIEAGLNTPQVARATPTEEDYVILGEELGRRGIDAEMWAAFENTKPDHEGTCYTAIAYFQILSDTDSDAYDQMLAYMVHGLASE